VFAETGIYGMGTYQAGADPLFDRALAGGTALVDTSPDYGHGETEEAVGRALENTGAPVFIMTQIPVEAWNAENREVAFHRALRMSLGRLKRERVEALLVRNAEPDQLTDPGFRAFAEEVKRRGQVGMIGASGHGLDMEQVLEAGLSDKLLDIFLFAANLARYQSVPELLPRLRDRGKILVAMKSREDALWRRAPGWEREDARRRHRPWDPRWHDAFARNALRYSVTEIPAHNVLMSLRHEEEVSQVLNRKG
jgi:aryl-alcohol dehydrogenase-like predicted oxidoreductase